jgi:hypothetical protein
MSTPASRISCSKRIVHLGAADPVHQDVDLDAGSGAFRQGVGELLADLAGPVDVGLKGDGFGGGLDRAQHGRKDLVAVEQLGRLVAAGDARPQQAAHGAVELRVGHAVLARQLLPDFFLSCRKVERQQHGSQRRDEGEEACEPGAGGGVHGLPFWRRPGACRVGAHANTLKPPAVRVFSKIRGNPGLCDESHTNRVHA